MKIYLHLVVVLEPSPLHTIVGLQASPVNPVGPRGDDQQDVSRVAMLESGHREGPLVPLDGTRYLLRSTLEGMSAGTSRGRQ